MAEGGSSRQTRAVSDPGAALWLFFLGRAPYRQQTAPEHEQWGRHRRDWRAANPPREAWLPPPAAERAEDNGLAHNVKLLDTQKSRKP